MGDPQGNKAAKQPPIEIGSKMVSVCECVCAKYNIIMHVAAVMRVVSVCMCVTACVLVCILVYVC